jgi:hypothetical protein
MIGTTGRKTRSPPEPGGRASRPSQVSERRSRENSQDSPWHGETRRLVEVRELTPLWWSCPILATFPVPLRLAIPLLFVAPLAATESPVSCSGGSP